VSALKWLCVLKDARPFASSSAAILCSRATCKPLLSKEGSFDDLLERAGIKDFRFHDLRHTFASWYMMNGGDLYELAKILGHSNIKMTERYAKLAKQHIGRTSNTAREMWKLLEPISEKEAVG
jgi:integrase